MLDDWTEFRNAKDQKALWKAAASLERTDLSRWIRTVLDEAATERLTRSPRSK